MDSNFNYRSEPKLSTKIKISLSFLLIIVSQINFIVNVDKTDIESAFILCFVIPTSFFSGLFLLLVDDLDLFVVKDKTLIISERKKLFSKEKYFEISLNYIKDCHIFNNDLYLILKNGEERKLLISRLDCFNEKGQLVNWNLALRYIDENKELKSDETLFVNVPYLKIKPFNKTKHFFSTAPAGKKFRIITASIGILILIIFDFWRRSNL